MNVKHLTRTLLALVAAGSVLAAQAKPAQEPTKPKEAVAAKVAPAPVTELRFSVTGLTKDNLSKVKESLTTLSFQTYTCDACKYEQSTAGKCAKCSADLKAEKKPLFAGAMPSPDDNSITLTMDQGHPTRFSDIESALKKNSINIDYTKFPITGKAHLVIRGGTADNVAAVEKAITDAKLFEEVHAQWDATANEIHVAVKSGATPPTRAKVTSAIEGSGLKVQFADVIWGLMPMAKKA